MFETLTKAILVLRGEWFQENHLDYHKTTKKVKRLLHKSIQQVAIPSFKNKRPID